MATETRLRIIVVDDHPATRLGLIEAINTQPDMYVVAQAGTWQQAGAVARSQACDVLLLDLNLPDGHGWTLLEQLRAAGQLPPTLVLSICDEHLYATRLLRSGARGYLMKDEPLPRILEAIRQVHAGHLATSASLATRLMQHALGTHSDTRDAMEQTPAGETRLSDRELQVFTLLGKGMRNKEVAALLGLSEKSVATYKVRLMEKLRVTNTPELIARFQTCSENPEPDSR